MVIAKTQYVLPQELKAEFDKSVVLGQPTLKLQNMIIKIATRRAYSKQFFYRNQCDRDAAINYAAMQAILKWSKYDEERSSNIFSFFTTIITNDLILYWNTLRKGKDREVSIDAIFDNSTRL